ncbi:MAG: YraN family protein [Polyangiaceae bacterium]
MKARQDGIRAERAAVDYLIDSGLDVLASNLRVGRFEIDVLAADGSVLVIVEVRTRGPGAFVRALDSVDARKRARLRLAGRWLWRDRYAADPRFERLRFDCIAVRFSPTGAPDVEHVRAAF